MPNYVSFRLRLDLPVRGTGGSLNFLKYLKETFSNNSVLKIELIDMVTNLSIGNVIYSGSNNSKIKQHKIGTVKQSVATAVIAITGATITSGTIDVIVEVERNGDFLLKYAAINLPVSNTALPTTLNAYQNLTPSSYITLPGPGITIDPTNQIAVGEDNKPPAFQILEPSVIAGASILSIPLWNLDIADCEAIAGLITLPRQAHPIPPPTSESLEAMYTGLNFSNAEILSRNNYENQLNSFNNGINLAVQKKWLILYMH